MKTTKSYFELLRHPNWQKKRLKILERAGFECEDCGSKDATFHVHHSYYEKGIAPWDYPDESLHCLCENCHKQAQDINLLLQRQLGKLGLSEIQRLLGYAFALEASDYPMVVVDVFSYPLLEGIADCWRLDPEEINDNLLEGSIDGYGLDQLRKRKTEK